MLRSSFRLHLSQLADLSADMEDAETSNKFRVCELRASAVSRAQVKGATPKLTPKRAHQIATFLYLPKSTPAGMS